MTEGKLALNREYAKRTTPESSELGCPTQSLPRRRGTVVAATDRPVIGLLGIADGSDGDSHLRARQESRGGGAGEHPVQTRSLGGSEHDQLRVLLDGGAVESGGRRACGPQPHLVDFHLRSELSDPAVSHLCGLVDEPSHLR